MNCKFLIHITLFFHLAILFSAHIAFSQPGPGIAEQKRIIQKAKKDYKEGNYSASLSRILDVYQLAQITNNHELFADAGNLIGLIYLAQNKPSVALSYFQKAADINGKLRLRQRLAANYLNISLCFSDLARSDSAIYYGQKTLQLSEAAGVKDIETMAHNHLGNYYFKIKNIAAAEKEYNFVLTNPKYRNEWEDSFAYTGLARIRYQQKKYRESADFADRGFELAKKTGTKWDAIQALDLAHQAYWNLGNASEAYQRLQELKLYSDSIADEAKEKELNGLLLKEKLAENQSLVKQVRITVQQRRIDQLIIVIITLTAIIVIVVAIIIFRRSVKARLKTKRLEESTTIAVNRTKVFEAQNADLNELNHHKDQLLSIIGHDLRSPFAMLQGTLALFHAGDLTEKEVVSVIAELEVQVNSATVMLDSLLVWAGKQLRGMTYQSAPVDLIAKVEKVIAVLSVVAKRKNVTITHQKSNLPLVSADPDQVRIIIQNLVSNAIKFTGDNGNVQIWYNLQAGHLDINIQDDGIGMTPEALKELLSSTGNHRSTYGTQKEKGIGLGMNLVKDFALQNKIVLTGTSRKGYGTTFQLRFYL